MVADGMARWGTMCINLIIGGISYRLKKIKIKITDQKKGGNLIEEGERFLKTHNFTR